MSIVAAPAEAAVSLYYREGSSDKEYHVRIEPKGELFVVNFAYGRRGTTLQTGTKTQTPVDYMTAQHLFEKLVNAKKAKGYMEGEAGTPYQHSDKASKASGILPQLLNPINWKELAGLISNNTHWAQEKYDGKRVLIQKIGSACAGVNRKGLVVGLPTSISRDVKQMPGGFILDGEAVGDEYFAFDLLALDGVDLRSQPYVNRYVALMNLYASSQHPHVRLAENAIGSMEKSELLEKLQKQGKEGIVFKREDAPYVPGRPNSGGSQLKYKFYATASFIVSGTNAKRSVGLWLFDHRRKLVDAGNVTIPPNQEIPPGGSVIEVKYLYAYRESGHVYQPIYLWPRMDISTNECTVSQLKYKAGEIEE